MIIYQVSRVYLFIYTGEPTKTFHPYLFLLTAKMV